MFATIAIIVLLLGGIVAKVAGKLTKLPEAGSYEYRDKMLFKNILRHGGTAMLVIAVVVLGISTIRFVPDGHVAVTRAFGQYGEETLNPGFNLIAPWETTTYVDARVKSYTFSDDADGEAIAGPISAQASGGGNLKLELTVQMAPAKETADDLLRNVGSDWFNIIGLPAIRSCARDSTTTLTLEEAYTTKRADIGTETFSCVAEKVESRGVVVFDVLIRDVDPGQAVRDAIDAKQQAEQDLQRAAITLEQERIKAQQEAVRAFGISQAEQIVACGGVETTTAEGETVIVPNESCEDQFSDEYLQWLYINALPEVDGVVILPPEFDGNLFVQTPNPANPNN